MGHIEIIKICSYDKLKMLTAIIIPGKRAGNIKQIVNNTCHNPTNACQYQESFKIIKNTNNTVIPLNSRVTRNVNAIKYSRGGITSIGNTSLLQQQTQQTQQTSQITQPFSGVIQTQQCLQAQVLFLGRSEGQPGGINGPLKNKF
jgi:hypothetical protein